MFHSATFNLNIRMYKRPLTAIVLFLYALILFQVMVRQQGLHTSLMYLHLL